jgi:hypothetical protein
LSALLEAAFAYISSNTTLKSRTIQQPDLSDKYILKVHPGDKAVNLGFNFQYQQRLMEQLVSLPATHSMQE